MMPLQLSVAPHRPLEILCVGAHPDDIEIGCGGTILRLAAGYPGCIFHWFVCCAQAVRRDEAAKAAVAFTKSGLLREPRLEGFRDGFLPFHGAEVKNLFEQLKQSVAPDVIFTHYRGDAHQDHRLLAELTWQTFRSHLILEYEIPKYDGDLGKPSVFVPLSQDTCREKVSLLMESFPSQQNRPWFREETFLALMRLRGIECAAPSGYAEAFYGRKLVL